MKLTPKVSDTSDAYFRTRMEDKYKTAEELSFFDIENIPVVLDSGELIGEPNVLIDDINFLLIENIPRIVDSSALITNTNVVIDHINLSSKENYFPNTGQSFIENDSSRISLIGQKLRIESR
ncbi:hypothetical protein HHI36_012512 [Cryptolaemus montrouzieri]|uniref:Uncharacterized protein n=1 Tax=Cryptolaemus montrouzieri TaxID=559131 RepID=A0ABD2NFL0_9CUCU